MPAGRKPKQSAPKSKETKEEAYDVLFQEKEKIAPEAIREEKSRSKARDEPTKKPTVKPAQRPPAKKGKAGKRKKSDSDSEEDIDSDYMDSVRKSTGRKAAVTTTDAEGKIVEVPAGVFPAGGIRIGLSRKTRPRAPLHPGARLNY